jgi:WD40 repeat protein
MMVWKGATMLKKMVIRSITIVALILLASCNLPEVTPTSTETPAVNTPFIESPIVTETSAAPVGAIEQITSKNASHLIIANKAAVSNVQQLVWSNDSQTIVFSTQNSDAGGTQVFGVTALNVPDLATKNVFSTQSSRIAAIAVDGRTVAAVSQDQNTVTYYDLGANNQEINSLTPGFRINNVTFSTDLTTIAVSEGDLWEVVLYSFVNGQELKRLTGYETAAPVYDAGFSKSTQWMVWQSRGTIQLQEIETGTMGARFEHMDFISALTMTNDGAILASLVGPSVFLWDAMQGTALNTIQLSQSAYALGFSSDGKLLAVGTGKKLELRDVSTGNLIASLDGHQDQINTIAFSPDGKYIATTGFDNQLYLWQVVP